MLISESIPQLIEMDAINIPSVLCFHVPAVPKKMMLKALWYVDHQKTHYVEIPAVQSQQQSPSVENANKKKVHM